jgi:1-acyl-sn-glycerol-3-phosphate acyltransferase
MIKAIFRALFKLHGWNVSDNIPEKAQNCVMVAAPHTSNWDFIYAVAALDILKINIRFTIKKELNKFPIGGAISSMGALWIDRTPRPGLSKKESMTTTMAAFFSDPNEAPLAMLVTAEGTRSRVDRWKTGFYHTALQANVPICLSYLDYQKKEAGIAQCFMPSGDLKKDMQLIMDFYRVSHPKFPENFALDKRYS